MKVIDLLNNIANGEEVPKKIIVDSLYYEYDKNVDYKSKNGKYLFDNYLQINEEDMNKEIEILGESKGIPKKLDILTFSDLIDMSKEDLVNVIKEQRFKINEILDYLESKGDE